MLRVIMFSPPKLRRTARVHLTKGRLCRFCAPTFTTIIAHSENSVVPQMPRCNQYVFLNYKILLEDRANKPRNLSMSRGFSHGVIPHSEEGSS